THGKNHDIRKHPLNGHRTNRSSVYGTTSIDAGVWTFSRKRNRGHPSGAGVRVEEQPMMKRGHLWAIGYEDMERAEQVRAEIVRRGQEHCLILLDTAVVVRHPDGCVTLNGEPFVAATNFGGHTFTSFLAGLVLGAPPLTAAAAGALVRGRCAASAEVGIDEE